MKALYLLIGLLLLTTIGIAPPTPFLVDGWVRYSNGNPVNDPEVNLTNLNTGEVFTAEINTNNRYQISPVNISTGDVVRFDFTDGITYNITNHTVTSDDLNSGGLFNFTLTLVSTFSGITGYSPDSPVHDIENTTRTFSTVESTVNSPPLFMIYGWVFENGSGCVDPVVNITNLNKSIPQRAQTDPDHYYYQLVLNTTGAKNICAGDVLQITACKDGVLINSTEHVITSQEISNATVIVDLNEGSIDLTISDISPPSGFYADKNNTVVAIVENSGTACTDGFEASFFVNKILNDTTRVPSMGPGSSRSINFNWMPKEEGHYTILVMADSGRKIIETNNSNNNQSKKVYVKFTDIDLAITDDIFLNKILDGDIIRVNSTIQNKGNDSADNFTVVFYDNNAAFHSEILSLGNGDSSTLSAYWNASYGEHNISVIIDPDNLICETDKMNNQDSSGVFFVNASRDFNITNISFTPSELEWGKSATINVTIKTVNLANRGCSVKVKFYRNPNQNIDEIELPFERGNNTQYATVEWHIDDHSSIGDLSITAEIDPDDKIHELNESNNKISIPIYVKTCDFTVTNITAKHTSLIFGDIVELNATIVNLGNATGNASVAFMVNSTDVFESRGISVKNISVDAGDKEYVSIYWNTSKTNLAGNCIISVEVDPDNKVCETNENNNSLTITRDPIFVNGTDLAVCEVIIPCPDHVQYEDELYRGDLVNVTARIKNQGSIDATNFSVGFYDNDSSGTISLIAVKNISSLSAGNCIDINATWDLLDASEREHHIQVKINHCDNPENDLSNNYNKTSREVNDPWILDVSRPSHPIKEGEDLIIAAIVTNKAIQDQFATVKFYSDHAYLDDILFKEQRIYVAGNSTNTTEIVWNARPLFTGPESILTTNRTISVSVDNSNPTPYSINIEPADLTIENIVVDPNYNVTITVKNNENCDIHPTFWFYDVNHTICDVTVVKECGRPTEGFFSIRHPDALNMSVYFIYLYTFSQEINSWYKVTDKNDNLIYQSTVSKEDPEYDLWTKWGAGDTINVTHMNMNGSIKSAALLEYRHISLNASETKNFTVQWNAHVGEDHTIWVQISNETRHKNLSLNIDLAVTDVFANSTTLDGNQETITATIANIGYGNASEFKVKFFVDDPTRLFYSTNITKLDSNTSTTVTANWTADTWNENEGKPTLNHTIWVEIDYCGNSDLNIINNRNSRPIQVNPTRDFSITNISFVQNEENEQITINATIENFGIPGNASISIYAEKDGRNYPVYSTTQLIDVKHYVNKQWNDANIVGHYNLNVAVDPDNRTFEINELNNSMILPVYIEAPDLTVVNLTIDNLNPLEGNTVNITAKITNVGDRPADANLTIYDSDRIPEEYNKYISPNRHTKKSVTIDRNNASAMRLYLWYNVYAGGYLRLYDNKNRLITLIPLEDDTFSGWTEWVVGDGITVELENVNGSAHLMISKYEYLTADDTIGIINCTLQTNNTTDFPINWNASTAGERNIVAIIDSGNRILELNEENNSKTEFLQVRGADLTISDLQLTVNGTEINDTDTIPDGTIVNINATITNIGIKPTAENFNVTLVCDDIHGERMGITNVTIPYLDPDNSTNVNATWNARIGDYTITAIADPENRIFETSNTNNSLSKNVVVLGADLSITGITFRVLPPDGADINDASSPVYDTDTVVINATIENQGLVQADNFSAYLFYEYEYLGRIDKYWSRRGDSSERWINKGYDGAECIFIRITNTSNINGRLIVYDGTGTEIARPDKSCWIPVMGDTANIKYSNVHGLGFTVDCYAGNIVKFEKLYLNINESVNISMIQTADTGGHPARVFADPENTIPGDPDHNNNANLTLHVLPSRDFIPEIYLTHNGSGIGVNDTVWDGDIVTVDVDIRMGVNESDPYNGYRKGTVDVDIINEHEWVDASPRYELTPYGYGYVFTHPHADAIRVHFKDLNIPYYSKGDVTIKDKDGNIRWSCWTTWERDWTYRYMEKSISINSPWVSGDTVYVYSPTMSTKSHVFIDKCQYRKINRTTVELAANGTANLSVRFTPDAWNNTMRVITDPENKTGELNESNNEINVTLHVAPRRDPAVVDITFYPEMPDPGAEVSIVANVTNYGSIVANFTVDLTAVKFEYWPCESPHGSWLVSGFDKTITTYPEANWTGVRFTDISTITGNDKTFLRIYDGNGNLSRSYYAFTGSDIWEWVHGDVIRVKLPEIASRCNIWGCEIDRRGHIVILNRTTVTLDPGETASVTGTLPNVRIGNQSFNYTITAVVDQDNTVFETNELNNVVSRELVARCPDLRVDFNPPDKAVIRNIGTKAAENVEVRLWHDVSNSRTVQSRMVFPSDEEMPDDKMPDAIRVHFKKLKFDQGDLKVKNETKGTIHTLPPGNYPDTWVEVEGEVCRIYCDYTDVEIDRYEYAYDIKVGDVPADDRKMVTIPWTEYEAPYNLTIDADPSNDIIESNEDNNNKTIRIGADLVPQWIYFSKPTEDKLIVDLKSTIEVTIMNDGTAPADEFNVTLDVRNVNGTVIFDQIKHISLSAMQSDKIEFVWTPSDSGYYKVYVITDSDGNVNELYENNNIRSRDIYVYPFSGYSGGGSLVDYKQEMVHGDVIFTIGDSKRLQSVSEDDTLKVTFDDAIPAKVKFARLYLYVDTGSDPTRKIALPIEVDMKFNGHMVQTDRRYTDISVASDWNVTYGLYCYDINPLYVDIEKENVAVATKIAPQFGDYYYFGIAAIGLLVVVEDDDAILTKYWINEGIDTVMAMNRDFDSGLPFEDCIVLAEFDNVEQEDLDSVNATLMAILSLVSDKKEFLYPEAKGEGDVLRFNEHQIGSLKNGSHWIYQRPVDVDTIAMTDNKWEYVTDNLKRGINFATFQSKGNYIVPSNAFLVLRYPPDLAVTDIDAPISAVVGKRYAINTTISNEGRSDATDFNVTFYSNGKKLGRQKVSRLDSGDNMTLQFNWKPMYMGKIYSLKVVADELSGPKWIELDFDNNVMTKNVPIVEAGFGNESGPIGAGGKGIGGDGKGSGTSLLDAITGYLMKGTVLGGEESGGGGGRGEYSLLGWVMKFAVLTTGIFIVCTGYMSEKLKYNKRK